ncbi:class I SAM-dependent methyltransferase [Nocardiopsis sp. MG754419]|uniref:class I SAM-dependent methyltransferase n=1 Tax=Nocardiopsis sp. MG754419 TaxID=2259865 RepID=UPI001BABC384|nr:methyltransferase domain-containing protein [Nocardiopsis sp. MG754419]MBR8742304.1 SAM-dependent methyltransferase [Nocardiopsis sp. MG754419]
MDERTRRVRAEWDRLAGTYDRGERLQRLLLGGSRERLCARARGRVLEVAVGSGHDLAYYPDGVQLTGVDLSPVMLARARERARRRGLRVRLVEGDAQDLRFADASFDTVVCALSLCVIPDQRRALEQMWRVLRPGGLLLLVDHIEYARWPGRRREARKEHPRHLPRSVARDVGFTVVEHGRTGLGLIEYVVATRGR